MADTVATDSFPRQQARTRRFTLGAPRSFQVSPDGCRVVFLRSKSGTDGTDLERSWCAERETLGPCLLAREGVGHVFRSCQQAANGV